MGKYLKKSKITGDVAVMEVSQSTFLGVRTRAKTLALQRLHSVSTSPTVAPNPDDASFSYLQLRSRRLEKPPLLTETKQQQNQQEPEGEVKWSCRRENTEPNPKARASSMLRVGSANSVSGGPVSLSFDGEGCFGKIGKMVGVDGNYNSKECCEAEDVSDVGIDASFGENNLDFEARDRSTRESTPCSFIRDLDNNGTPSSTTRQRSSAIAHRRGLNDMQRVIPTTHEMEEFFAYAEQQQQRLFMEKYNYDIVNDLPLPGRYEWVQVVP